MKRKAHKNGNRPVEYISYKVDVGTNEALNHNAANQIINALIGRNRDKLRLITSTLQALINSLLYQLVEKGIDYKELSEALGCTYQRAKAILGGLDVHEITVVELAVIKDLVFSQRSTGTRNIAAEVMETRLKK